MEFTGMTRRPRERRPRGVTEASLDVTVPETRGEGPSRPVWAALRKWRDGELCGRTAGPCPAEDVPQHRPGGGQGPGSLLPLRLSGILCVAHGGFHPRARARVAPRVILPRAPCSLAFSSARAVRGLIVPQGRQVRPSPVCPRAAPCLQLKAAGALARSPGGGEGRPLPFSECGRWGGTSPWTEPP